MLLMLLQRAAGSFPKQVSAGVMEWPVSLARESFPPPFATAYNKALSVDWPGGLCFVQVNYRLYSSVYFLVR